MQTCIPAADASSWLRVGIEVSCGPSIHFGPFWRDYYFKFYSVFHFKFQETKHHFHASREHACCKGAGLCKIAFCVTSFVTSAQGIKQSQVPLRAVQAFNIVGLGMMMSKSATNKSKTSMQFVAFKCMHCNGEYATQCAYNGTDPAFRVLEPRVRK